MEHTQVSDYSKKILWSKAVNKSGNQITPCSSKTWDQCFQVIEILDRIMFYYNTEDNSTHTVSINIQKTDRFLWKLLENKNDRTQRLSK